MAHKQLQRKIDKWVAKQSTGSGVLLEDDGDGPDGDSLKAGFPCTLRESVLSVYSAAASLADPSIPPPDSPGASTAAPSTLGASTVEPHSRTMQVWKHPALGQ